MITQKGYDEIKWYTWKEESWITAPSWVLEADNTEKLWFSMGVLKFKKGFLKLFNWQQEEEMDLGKNDDLIEEDE